MKPVKFTIWISTGGVWRQREIGRHDDYESLDVRPCLRHVLKTVVLSTVSVV